MTSATRFCAWACPAANRMTIKQRPARQRTIDCRQFAMLTAVPHRACGILPSWTGPQYPKTPLEPIDCGGISPPLPSVNGCSRAIPARHNEKYITRRDARIGRPRRLLHRRGADRPAFPMWIPPEFLKNALNNFYKPSRSPSAIRVMRRQQRDVFDVIGTETP